MDQAGVGGGGGISNIKRRTWQYHISNVQSEYRASKMKGTHRSCPIKNDPGWHAFGTDFLNETYSRYGKCNRFQLETYFVKVGTHVKHLLEKKCETILVNRIEASA